MSRCGPLNLLNENNEHPREQQNVDLLEIEDSREQENIDPNESEQENINSSESERSIDYLMNFIFHAANMNVEDIDSYSSKPSEDEDLTFNNVLRTQDKYSSLQKIISGGNSSKESSTEGAVSKSCLEGLPVIMKTESIRTEPSVSQCIRETTCMPTSQNWEGSHNFRIKVSYDGSKGSFQNAIYCPSVNKLFIVKDYPFKILFSANNVPSGSIIRATAFYTNASYAFEVVKRCPDHLCEDKGAGKEAFEHVLQSFHIQALYEKNVQSGRYSVVIPYTESEKVSEECVCITYKFVCWGSCTGGINRRPLIVHFTLENKYVLLGRQVLHVKVCACPTRDSKAETEEHSRSCSLPPSHVVKCNSDLSDSSSSDDDDSSQYFTIFTKDLRLYEFLKQMKAFYKTNIKTERLRQFVNPKSH